LIDAVFRYILLESLFHSNNVTIVYSHSNVYFWICYVATLFFSNLICIFSAFDLCITLMDIGETCQVITEARFAYGSAGRSGSFLYC